MLGKMGTVDKTFVFTFLEKSAMTAQNYEQYATIWSSRSNLEVWKPESLRLIPSDWVGSHNGTDQAQNFAETLGAN
jgi:hypothetical protein